MNLPIKTTTKEKLEDIITTITLGEQLTEIIEDENDQNMLTISMNSLKEIKPYYEKQLKQEKITEACEQELEKKIDDYIKKTKKDYETHEQAKKTFKQSLATKARKRKQHPYRSLAGAYIEGIGLGTLATCIYPLTKTTANKLFSIAKFCFRQAASIHTEIQQRKTIYAATQQQTNFEHLEAVYATKLAEKGMPRELADTLLANPPYLSIFMIHYLKEKHADWF
ncbi:MAG: hypothetical protein Q7R96_00180 [Nanoarchaeota archaeon]|nr:hypothetical protein [Nanoarchaeota archaeon]